MRTITLYHDPQHQLLHQLVCEVDRDTGHHTVLSSDIISVSSLDMVAYKKEWVATLGEDNVRAYNLTEV